MKWGEGPINTNYVINMENIWDALPIQKNFSI
jgi:hypothetical protein